MHFFLRNQGMPVSIDQKQSSDNPEKTEGLQEFHRCLAMLKKSDSYRIASIVAWPLVSSLKISE